MKRTGRVLAILLALAMLLSVTAFAATTTSTWYGYGGDTTTHNAAVTSAPTSTSPTITRIDLMNAGSGWDGIDNVPVMRTIDGGPTPTSSMTAMLPAADWQRSTAMTAFSYGTSR